MKILEWEKQLAKRYKVKKITDFQDLRDFLTNKNYYPNFVPGEVSEGQFCDEEFYAGYVFNEEDIVNRKTIAPDSGWDTTIILISSMDGVKISDYHIVGMNHFSMDEARKFISETTKPILDSQAEMK